MKHKKNTRHRHKPRNKTRKTRKTRNTHKKYKRCRTRRGGKTKEELYDEVLSETLKTYKSSIPSYFINYDTFKNFLDVYGASELQKVVCGNHSEEYIRLHENQHLTNIKKAVENVSNPTPKIIFIKDLFLTSKFINSWTDFVISLKNSVDARSSDDLNERLKALKEDPLKPPPPPPQLNLELVPPSKRVLPRPASGSEVDTRPYPPPGFILKGNVYENTKGDFFPAEYYKPLPAPAAPAAPAAAASPASPAAAAAAAAPAHRAPLTGQALIDALNALNV